VERDVGLGHALERCGDFLWTEDVVAENGARLFQALNA
jgi:hypothetical protein